MIKRTEKTYNIAYKIIFIVLDALKKDILKRRLVMTSFWSLLLVCLSNANQPRQSMNQSCWWEKVNQTN